MSDTQGHFSLGDSLQDVRAWYQARMRADAARRVEAERLDGAVYALREDGHSIRRIAEILEVPQTRVARELTRTGQPHIQKWEPLADGVGVSILEAEATHGNEYRAAHNSAWRHHLPAQMPTNV